MDLKNQIDQATQGRTEKAEAKAKALQGAADAKGNLADTTTTRDDDSKYLSDLTATRQQLRAQEIEAIEKAIEILSGLKPAALVQAQPTRATSLAQLRSRGSEIPEQAQ